MQTALFNDRKKFEPTESICMAVTLRKPSGTKKVNTKTQKGVEINCDEDLTSLRKKFMECNEFEAVCALDRKITKYLTCNALPFKFVKSGVYLLPPASIEEIDAKVQEFLIERKELVKKFVAVYDTLPEAMKERLKDLWDEGDYAPVDGIEVAFDAEIQYLQFTVPGTLAQVSGKIYKREHEKAANKLTAAIEDIEAMLASTAKEFCDYLIDVLSPGEDGKEKTFRKEKMDRITEFFKTLKDRNITGNETLDKIAATGLAIMQDGVDADLLRKSGDFREQVKGMFETVLKPLVDEAVIDRPGRKVRLAD